MTAATPLRRTAGPVRLIATAIGGPRAVAGKLRRLGRTALLYVRPGGVERRLETLASRGLAPEQPTRVQLFFGGFDMLRFLIEPAARDYYQQQGISFGFHQLLRVLDDPVSMIDPTGFLSERDTIIGHVMQVVHLNPIYDLQILQAFPDGLEELESQVAAMVAGSHPRAGTIGAIVEDPSYHARLLEYVRSYRQNPETPHLTREEQTLRVDPHFAAAEKQFATLPSFLEYCGRLPRRLGGLVSRYRLVSEFPLGGPAEADDSNLRP